MGMLGLVWATAPGDGLLVGYALVTGEVPKLPGVGAGAPQAVEVETGERDVQAASIQLSKQRSMAGV
jgi:hypothetical protein